MRVGTLAVDLKMMTAQFDSSLRKTTNDFSRNMAAMQRDARKFRIGVAKSFAAVTAGFAAIRSMGGLTRMVTETVDVTQELGKLADSTGFNVEKFQAYRHAAELAGVGQTEFAKGIERLAKNMGEAANGGTAYMDAFERMGVQVTDQLGNLRKTDAVFQDMIESLSRFKNEADVAQMTTKIFGREGIRFGIIFKEGAKSLREAEEHASALGVVLDEQLVRNAEAADDAMTNMSRSIQGLKSEMLLGFTPAITKTASALTNFIGMYKSFALITAGLVGETKLDLVLQGINQAEKTLKNANNQYLVEMNQRLENAPDPDLHLPDNKPLDIIEIYDPKDLKKALSLDAQFDVIGKFQKDIADLNRLRDYGLIEAEVHTRALAAENENLRRSYSDLLMSTREWSNGAMVALSDYHNAASDAAQNTYNVFDNAFRGIEDSLVNAFTGVKFSFRDMAASIQADLMRMAVRQNITAPLAGMLGMQMGGPGFLFGGGFAGGGMMLPNTVNLVGEHGPELVIPQVASAVVPNHQLGRSAGGLSLGDIHVHVHGDATEDMARRTGTQVSEDVTMAILAAQRNL